VAVPQLDGEAAELVGPLVERAAAAEVEARVVPVAGEDAVLHRPAVEREAHVRAAVVDRVHGAAVGEEDERVTAEVDDEPPGAPYLGERGSADESVGDGGADHVSQRRAWRSFAPRTRDPFGLGNSSR